MGIFQFTLVKLRFDFDCLFISYAGNSPDVPRGNYFSVGYFSVGVFFFDFRNFMTYTHYRHILSPWDVFTSPLGLILMVI